MTLTMQDLAAIALIGVGATAVLDLWLLLLKRLGVRTLDFALMGRWVGHLHKGRWAHDPIAKSPPVRGERAFGWLFHYAVGIAFAGVLLALQGMDWARQPSLLPALAVGLGSLAAPLFVMQPAMGAGIASSRTPAPLRSNLRSLANHTVFGAGLYLAAVALRWIAA